MPAKSSMRGARGSTGPHKAEPAGPTPAPANLTVPEVPLSDGLLSDIRPLPPKQRRFVLAAKHLLLTRPQYRRLRVRIDVVAIDPPAEPGDAPVITWIRNAFEAG